MIKQKPRRVRPLDLADRQIQYLKDKLLPYDPHLLQVDIKNPYNGGFAHEFEGTPFENYEVKDLQYMTMISDGCRGIADAKGDWQAEINSRSPSVQAMRSNTATPNAGREAKGPLKKISFGQYKNKKAGITTTPQPGAKEDGKPAHSRNTSDVSVSTPMRRVPSFEGSADARQNGASLVVIATERAASKSVAQASNTSETKPKANLFNGHDAQPSRGSLQSKDTNKSLLPPKASTQQPRDQLKNGLPPRPQSPARGVERKPPTSEPKQLKRPLDSADSPHEKRAKIEQIRTPSGTLGSARRPEPLSDKKHQDSPHKTSSQPSKSAPSTKQPEGRDSAKSDRPLRMPPLLSPLPADLDNSSPILKVKITEPSQSSTNSPKAKFATDTIIVKTKLSNSSLSTSSPLSTPAKSSSSPYVLPRLLSPTLPDVVEEELLRIHKKSTTAAQNGVEARHENARRPDAPGVARKMPKTAKKTVDEAPKAEASKTLPVPEKESLIVRLKYKRRKANDIARILKLQAKPSKQFLNLEKENTARSKPKIEYADDTLVAPISKPSTSSTTAKKRPSDSFESRTLESAAERVKVDTMEVPKPRPANTASNHNKSPLPSAPSQKNLLITPKKNDTLKSVAMRKIDSNDGNIRTPQAVHTSITASAEKPRANGVTNGEDRSKTEHDRLSTKSFNLDAHALKLKRKMDEILQTKVRPQVTPGESQRILGLCVGMECVVMYLQSFAASEKVLQKRSNTAWEGGMRLWQFIHEQTKNYRVLNALSCQIGAVFKEELGRVLGEMMEKNHQNPRFLAEVKGNQQDRDVYWKLAHRSRGVLDELGARGVMGPWTSVEECTTYTLDVLERYARKEKTGWRMSS